jgi:hypothetical protein
MIALEQSTGGGESDRGNWRGADLPGHSRVNLKKNLVVFLIAKFWIPVFKIRKIHGLL